MKFIEASAKTSLNVSDSFITMTKEIITILQEKEQNQSKQNGILYILLNI